jgi:putative methyltransferase (TIGR04325 family)
MPFTQIVKYILPPLAVDAARWFMAGGRLTRPAAGHVHTHYEVVPEWRPPKEGTGTFDFGVATRPVAWELGVPIVRDNLEALRLLHVPEATLLDFGCGNGHYQAILAAWPHTAKWAYIGVDSQAACVQFCRRTYPTSRFETVAEGQPLPFPDDAFDIVLASGVIQYIQNEVMTLAELHRVTRAYVLVSRLPTWKYQASQLVRQYLRGAFGEEHYPLHVFNRGQIEDLFAQVGFAVVWRDYGSEFFTLAGEREPVAHLLYLLRKVGTQHGRE